MTQPAEPGPREAIRASYERACARFRELLASMSDADFRRRRAGEAWAVREVAAHVVTSLEMLPALVAALRAGKTYLNYPAPVLAPLNQLFVWWTARRTNRNALAQRFDAASRAVLALLDGIADHEWERVGKAFGERLTVEDALRREPEHIEEHIAQIQRLLGHA